MKVMKVVQVVQSLGSPPRRACPASAGGQGWVSTILAGRETEDPDPIVQDNIINIFEIITIFVVLFQIL